MPILRSLVTASCLALCVGACAQSDSPARDTAANDTAMTGTPSEEWPATVYATLTTSMGDIVIELDHENAPVSTENFVQYAEDGSYDGTVFHRVMDGFMIQGGGFTTDGIKKDTREGISNEWRNGLSNLRGTVAMARLGRQPDSGTNQFFINVNDNHFLNEPRDGAGYAVFGEVVEGMDVVDKIKGVDTGTKQTPQGPMGDWPNEDVVIESVTILQGEEAEQLRAEREQAAKDMWEAQLAEAKATIEGLGHDPSEGAMDEETGLWILELGGGDGPQPSMEDTVEVHYTGWLTKGGTPFDSSRERDPATFGLNQVIPGWGSAVSSMSMGGRRIVVIPTELAYFKRGVRQGARTIIPPDAALIFDIELLDIKGDPSMPE